MATLAAICDQIQATLESVGLRAYNYEVDRINAPCVHVAVGDSPIPDTFNQGIVTYNLELEVFVASVSDRASQVGLRSYLSWTGPNSIAQAIFAHPTLMTDPAENTAGTPTMTAWVRGFHGYDPAHVEGQGRFAYAVVEIEVRTRGDS